MHLPGRRQVCGSRSFESKSECRGGCVSGTVSEVGKLEVRYEHPAGCAGGGGGQGLMGCAQ